jgi:hypothetical protein
MIETKNSTFELRPILTHARESSVQTLGQSLIYAKNIPTTI